MALEVLHKIQVLQVIETINAMHPMQNFRATKFIYAFESIKFAEVIMVIKEIKAMLIKEISIVIGGYLGYLGHKCYTGQ